MSLKRNLDDFYSAMSTLIDAASDLESEWGGHLSLDIDELIQERDELLDRVAELEKEGGKP